MGCVSSTLLKHDDDFSQIGGSTSMGHHIVSLTSTTYGFLTLDPSPPSSSHSPTFHPTPPPPFTLRHEPSPEIINSWELMAGLDPNPDSFRFSPLLPSKPFPFKDLTNILHSNPPHNHLTKPSFFKPPNDDISRKSSVLKYSLDGFEKICPPNGENNVVIYTTTLRGVRSTFEACNAVRSAFEGLGVLICERDVSMDRGFREELRVIMKGKENSAGEMAVVVLPRVFVKGRYIGGAEEVMRIVENGCLMELLEGLPKLKAGYVCEGCGGVRFLPCFRCNGSCKMVMVVKEEEEEMMMMGHKHGRRRRTVVVRCSDCNENGLVLCPICS